MVHDSPNLYCTKVCSMHHGSILICAKEVHPGTLGGLGRAMAEPVSTHHGCKMPIVKGTHIYIYIMYIYIYCNII